MDDNNDNDIFLATEMIFGRKIQDGGDDDFGAKRLVVLFVFIC